MTCLLAFWNELKNKILKGKFVRKININKVTAPASKSYLQRAMAIASLTIGTSKIENVTWSNDTNAVKHLIQNIGADVVEHNNELIVTSKGLKFEITHFNAGESGLALRMFSPVLALNNKEITFSGEGSLTTRPSQIIADALTQLNVKVKTDDGFLPLIIKGKIKPGSIKIDGSLSSQLLSGLLITLPLLSGDSIIDVANLKSRPYIDMTLSIMKHFGVEVENHNYKIFKIEGNQHYTPAIYTVEGDWSSSAFFLVFGAVKGSIEVMNLNPDSLQADRAIITALNSAGADTIFKKNSVVVTKNRLNAFEFDATHCPDLFPPLVCLASQCKGTSTITGVTRLVHKESNRATVLKEVFANIGIKLTLDGDYMYITGSQPTGGVINSHNDHRIAMTGALMDKFSTDTIEIINKNAVNKSYPEFFEVIKSLTL